MPQHRAKGGVSQTSSASEQKSYEEHQSDSGGAGNPDQALSATHGSVIADDRDLIEGDRVLLIIEDDPTFAKIILDLAREKGFKGIVAMRGLQALEPARSHKPDAITLDIHLPDIDGWTILDALKRDPELRHIPVDVITADDYPLRALSRGAFQVSHQASEPSSTCYDDGCHSHLPRSACENLLLVTADKDEQKQITDLLGDGDITIAHADSGKKGLAAIGKKSFDCVVVGTNLADMSGSDFITAVRQDKSLGRDTSGGV